MLPGSYCHVPRMSCGLPPAASTTKSRRFLNCAGAPTNAMRLLSGDQTRFDSSPEYSSFRGLQDAAFCSQSATGMMKISLSLRGSSSRLRSGGSLAIESRSAVTDGVRPQLGIGDERDPLAVGRHESLRGASSSCSSAPSPPRQGV